MKKVLMMAPMGSVHRRFNAANIEALRNLGCEVHLLANFEKGDGTEQQNLEYAERCRQEGIVIHSLPFVRASLLKNIGLVKEIKSLFKRENFNIIHAHTETGGLLLRLSISAAERAKFVYTPHGMSFYKGAPLKTQLIYRPIERWICGGMDANLGMNLEELDVLQKWDRKTAYYVHGIGLDLKRNQSVTVSREEIRNRFGIPDDAMMIVSVGELDDNKNHSSVVRALGELRQNNLYYVVCGVGTKRDELIALAKSCGIGDKVILAGYRKDIPNILHAADLFIFPSYHEGLPVSLMEAMASGLPVICSKIRGNVDLIQEGRNGFLFNPNDYNTLIPKIQAIISNRELVKYMSEQNKEDVEGFSYRVVVNELETIYNE